MFRTRGFCSSIIGVGSDLFHMLYVFADLFVTKNHPSKELFIIICSTLFLKRNKVIP